MSGASVTRRVPHRSEAASVELFFDLVYVFAIIQLSHVLIDHLSWTGAVQMSVVFAAVWWGWNYTAWAMNWLNPESTPVQLLTAVLMVAALGMSVAIQGAFADQAWLFVACYVAMGIIRPIFMMLAFRGQQMATNYMLLLLWTLFAGIFWLVGAALEPQWRLLVWVLAVLIDYMAPLAQFRVPGIGSAPGHLWDSDGEHLAERNRLVFIIALGESILLMGEAIVEHGHLDLGLAISLLIGFVSLFVLWWNYFALAANRGGKASTAALSSAYAYAHALMVLGAILVAVSIELRLTHEHLTPAIVLVTVAGPVAYLIGNFLFLRSRFGRLARSRLVAIAVLAVIAVVGLWTVQILPVMALSLAVLAVTAALAVLTAWSKRAPTEHTSVPPAGPPSDQRAGFRSEGTNVKHTAGDACV